METNTAPAPVKMKKFKVLKNFVYQAVTYQAGSTIEGHPKDGMLLAGVHHEYLQDPDLKPGEKPPRLHSFKTGRRSAPTAEIPAPPAGEKKEEILQPPPGKPTRTGA